MSRRIGSGQAVIFLAPMGAHNAIAVEAWQAVAQWDLQTDDQGTVHALRYGADEGDPEYMQTLTDLMSRITTAAASDAHAGQRIANVSGLTQYYWDMGAYDDITPDDGSTETFTPVQPPPVPECASGGAVPNASVNRALVHDCQTLLGLEDTLAGTATLNWSADLAIGSWTGLTVGGGTPQRVTGLSLASSSLNGIIPAELGTLWSLTVLDLSSNSLTGGIPVVLGGLPDLATLRLSGNALSGCIPAALREVAVNDLASLNLLYCDMLPLPAAPPNLSVSLADGTFALTWDSVSGAASYEVQHRASDTDEWTPLPEANAAGATYTPQGGPVCETTYQFRVRAFGDGMTLRAGWSTESVSVPHTTEACNAAPEFDSVSYSFAVAEGAAEDSLVGTVAASDPDEGDVLAYSITAGNEEGKFGIGESSGEITVAGALDYETIASYTLTVQADDGQGGTAAATVAITVEDEAEYPPPVPEGLTVALASDIFTLAWDAVSGAVSYEAQYRIPGTLDEWTPLPEVEDTETDYAPEGAPLCREVYEFRVRAFGDGILYAETWGVESSVETSIKEDCNRDPAFDSASYSFTLDESALTGSTLGTVVATDRDEEDTVSFLITAGNDEEYFALDAASGEITLAAAVEYDRSGSYTLTVRAEDGRGGSAEASAVITQDSACRNYVVTPGSLVNEGLFEDCLILYGTRDWLAGTGFLNWNADRYISNWHGVSVYGTPERVRMLRLQESGLSGSIPASLGSLSQLTHIYLQENELTGEIPPELGNLPELRKLRLDVNRLTGNIPGELGGLSQLEQLLLDTNQLRGSIRATAFSERVSASAKVAGIN